MANDEDINDQSSSNKSREGAGNDNKSIANVIRDGIGVVASGVVAGMAFSLEHKFVGIVFTYVAVAAALHVPFELYAERHEALRCRTWISYFILLVIIAGAFASCSAKVLKPEPKPYPHLKFSLQTDVDPECFIELTNSSLIVSSFGDFKSLAPMMLFVPHLIGRESIGLQFVAENKGPVDAENLEVAIGISDGFSCVADPAWEPIPSFSVMNVNGNRFSLASWVFRVPPIHPGDGFRLPIIHIIKPPILDLKHPQDTAFGSFAILARAKDSPAQSISAFLGFVPYSTNGFLKPFVLPRKGEDKQGFSVDIVTSNNADLMK